MRVQLPNGKFAAKTSKVYQFVNAGKGTVEEYFKWATECGLKASHSSKDRIICEKLDLDEIAEIKEVSAVNIPEGMDFNELNEFILNESENPADIAASWLEVDQMEDDSIAGFIDENLSPVTKESFERWGDVNTIDQVSPSWFKKDGLHIDIAAMKLTEIFGKEITEQDIVDYLTTYRKGRYKSSVDFLSDRYKSRFYQITGFKLTVAYAKHLRDLLFVSEAETTEVPF
ncbi:hypothetical protein [Jiulongibacter sp. NS-SX5]|uniref:hypothetical protein n=1 Tax=Jiulongibacter sp. NS-SX5 TaxID=3463854 RepID=UPI0040599D01